MMIWGQSQKTWRWTAYSESYNLSYNLSVDITQAFSSVTIPPIIKTVVHNGSTLIYRVQNTSMDQEFPHSLQVSR